MSLDTVARRASTTLRSAVSDADIDRALHHALDRSDDNRRWIRLAGPLLVAAVLVLLLAVGWAGSQLLTTEQSAPPLQPAPSETVGARLSVPVEASVPDGWNVQRDARAVELGPMDGSDRSIILLGQPVVVYQSPDYQLKPLREDLVVWTTTHPDLEVSDQFGLDGPDFAWTGTEMELALRRGTSDVPLVPIPGRPYPMTPLSITEQDRTFLWDVIYLTDSPPLLMASRSSIPNDAELKSARNELLQSLQVNPPPN
jgi:hypothetical protein